MLIGFDDTDSVKGMCTTYLATEMIREFSEYDLLGFPRLVRLNPNVPWKTRGNAALCIRLGTGTGKPQKIGEMAGRDILCYPRGKPIFPTEEMFEKAIRIIEKNAVFGDPNTNPGLAISFRKPPAGLYWKAVRDVVWLQWHLEEANPDFAHGWKNKRGIIGAVSAMAWQPRDRTYELIAYREPGKWGRPRHVDGESVKRMDRKFPGTFNNYDYEEKRPVFAPNSPCPILFGIRGEAPGYLPAAMRAVKSEKVDRWLIFLTNQATDDHIVPASISSLKPYTSVRVRGRVAGPARIIRGGHLIFPITNGPSTVDCTIYEPAKKFRMIGEQLRTGDFVIIQGAVRDKPLTINIEKLHVVKLSAQQVKVANPLCRKCGKRMKSVGRGQGYRCARCGAKSRKAEYATERRDLRPGWYEPTVGAMRHLAKPLKRFSR